MALHFYLLPLYVTYGIENPAAVFLSSDLNCIHIFLEREVNAIGRSLVSQASYEATEDGFSVKVTLFELHLKQI